MADVFGSLLGGVAGGAIGAAIVQLRLDAAQYERDLAKARGDTHTAATTMGAGWTKFGAVAAAGAVAAGTAVVAFAGRSIQAAADQGEALNKSAVIFGENATEVERWADRGAEAFGLSKTAALEAAAGFGAMLQSAGLAVDESADMSESLVQLAGDMASFNNIDPTEALEKLRSGLAGEAEPLRRFGVFLSEAAVQQQAYQDGIAAVGAELTEAEKVQARYNLIFEQTIKQQGDFGRTADSLPNQIRATRAEFENVSAEVGQSLVPVMTELLKVGKDLLPVIGALAEGLSVLAESGGLLFGPIGVVIDTIANGVPVMEEMTDVLAASAEGAQVAADKYTESFGLYASGLDAATEATKDHTDAVREQIDVMLAQADAVFGVIAAVRDDKDAEDALAEARRELHRLTEAGRDGTKAYAEAQRDYEDAVLAAAEAQAGLIGSVQQLRTDVEEGETTLRDAEKALRTMGKEAGLSKEEIDGLVASLREGTDAGEAFGEGLADGITNELPNVIAAATRLAEAAADAAQRALRAQSPSEVMRELGQDFVAGFIEGVDDEQGNLLHTIRDAMEDITAEVERQLEVAGERLQRTLARAADFRGAVSGGFSSFLDISGALGLTGGDIGAFFGNQLAGAQEFASVLNQLQAQGASAALLQQIAAAGPGALGFAQELLAQGPGAIGDVGSALQQIADLAESTAKGLSEEYFGSKIDELRDELRELRDVLRVLERPQRLEVVFRAGGEHALRALIADVIREMSLSRASL